VLALLQMDHRRVSILSNLSLNNDVKMTRNHLIVFLVNAVKAECVVEFETAANELRTTQKESGIRLFA
jgi:hypothetical protein